MEYTPAVYVIDDDPAICKSLAWFLGALKLPVQVYNSPLKFLSDVTVHHRGCILLDMHMAEMNGLTLQKSLNAKHIAMPIIFLTGHGDAQMAVEGMKAGAMDFMNKPYPEDTLLNSIRRALDKDVANHELYCKRAEVKLILQDLTPQQYSVLRGIVSAHSSKAIASSLDLSVKSVERYRGILFQKFNVHTVVELTKLIYQCQIPLPEEGFGLTPGALSLMPEVTFSSKDHA